MSSQQVFLLDGTSNAIYRPWRRSILAALAEKGVTDGIEPPLPNRKTEHSCNAAIAYRMIARSLGEKVLTEFGRYDSAGELWKALEVRFGTMDALEIHKLKVKLIANQRSNFSSMSE